MRTAEQQAELIETQLDDLQAEMEAGSRQVDKIRGDLLARHLQQADLLGTLTKRMNALRKSIRQQRESLDTIREQIRARRLR